MKGNAKVVQMLNEVLVGEITAVNQYFLGAKTARHKGYARLHDRLYRESVEEMKHAERLVERILFLDGLPNLQKLEKIRVAESVPEQLRFDLQTEKLSVDRLNTGIEMAREHDDNGTADLLQELLDKAESHVEWLETQLALVRELGDAHYLAQQIQKDG
jgi:bacterioferritin